MSNSIPLILLILLLIILLVLGDYTIVVDEIVAISDFDVIVSLIVLLLLILLMVILVFNYGYDNIIFRVIGVVNKNGIC